MIIPKRKAWLIIFALLCVGLFVGAATQVDLTANVRGILPGGNGGTGSAFFSVSGPTALRTFTFPDANKTIMATDTAVTATQLPNPSASTLGGVESLDCTGSGHLVKISTTGVPTCAADPGALNFSDNEVPTGTPNGVLTTFTLAHTPNPAGSLTCFENGLEQRAAGADFTLATATMTYVVAPPTNTTLACNYRY